ncbi:MAG: DnaB-like helicase C-terminal domain-containing protein [Clostridiales bacterium]|jgi:replicative DNA helicase|nr:DnaB-like helicase C-terminal domain-containing protein [Clostridiales bacterium]
MYYLYRFLNENNEVIYIGRTNNIERRIFKEHFTDKTHLPVECYKELRRIEYTEIEYEAQEVAFEILLIQKIKPKYNVQFKYDEQVDIEQVEHEWKELKIDNIYFEFFKNRKDKVQSIEDYLGFNLVRWAKEDTLSFNTEMQTGFIEYDARCKPSVDSLNLFAGNNMNDNIDFALNIVINNVYKQDKKVLILSSIHNAHVITNKILASLTMVDYNKIVHQILDGEDWDRIAKCLNDGKNKLNNIQIRDVREKLLIKELEKLLIEDTYDIVLIDDLNVIQRSNEYEKDKLLDIMQELKWISKKYLLSLILLEHNVRNAESRADHRPMLRDLPYFSMEKYSDVVGFIYRDEMYNPDTEKQNISEIIIAKNAFGIENTIIELVRILPYCRYVNKEREEEN